MYLWRADVLAFILEEALAYVNKGHRHPERTQGLQRDRPGSKPRSAMGCRTYILEASVPSLAS